MRKIGLLFLLLALSLLATGCFMPERFTMDISLKKGGAWEWHRTSWGDPSPHAKIGA